MIKKTLHIFFAIPLLMMAFASCTDDLLYDDTMIGEGEGQVSVTLDFHPLVTTDAESSSRSAGDALSDINSLSIFVYDSEGKLYKIYNKSDLDDFQLNEKNSSGSNTDMPNDAGGKPVQAEESTARATFTMKHIAFGRYFFYAVANMGDFEDNEANHERFARASALKQTLVEWNNQDVAANNQMFGYFTYNTNDEKTSVGFEAPLLIVNKKMNQFHSWIKRAASKVTLVYDGAGLKEGVWIYIKNVTIHDIPRYCKIGDYNSVHTTDADSMYVNGETIRYGKDGVLGADETQGQLSTDWMMVSNGTGLLGAVGKDADGNEVIHSETDEALYFYENMQGNYADAADKDKYYKKDIWPNVGFNSNKPGDYDYKDNVPYGTYIEVEAYYVSENPEQVSQGTIKYRYMLGQDDDYDYNAIRNHHYKLTLGFNGWANQPTWHIEYFEPEEEFFNDPTYYVSYMYNQKSVFPIRFTGALTNFEVEIVENNWAPYDPKSTDSVPPDHVQDPTTGIDSKLDFRWNREAYYGKAGPANSPTNYNGGEYNYSLQSPRNYNGQSDTTYTDALAPKKVTPIWAGFLALMVPEGKLASGVLLQSEGYTYNRIDDRRDFKNYFYGKFKNTIPQNIRRFTEKDLTVDNWVGGAKVTKTVGKDNNACEIVKNPDGSMTINFPMWTRPKILLGISGFSGNNPYDTYQRKAVVRLKATFKSGKVVERFVPVRQVRRVVNPKGVWRKSSDNDEFHVQLCRRPGASSAVFETFKSEGAWRAYVKAVTPGSQGFITLVGGIGYDETGAIVGNTDTPVDFKIKFNNMGVQGKSHCAIVEVEYHGFTCVHSIFVRQGYSEPLAINGTARWSSYSLFKTGTTLNNDGTVSGDVPYKTTFSATGTGGKPQAKDYVAAVLTANPLSLGTLFKRGNYNGILVKNNGETGLGALMAPGQNTVFAMANGTQLTWQNIRGLAFVDKYWGSTVADEYTKDDVSKTFAWTRFTAKVNGETRYYRVPKYEDYDALLSGDYGLGVLYADGATETEMNVADAYGFEDFKNIGTDNDITGTRTSTRGMRGIIVFNPTTAAQLFFPLGARGIGRRTIQDFTANAWADFGTLRYGAKKEVLTGTENALRPIPYNLPASPGAVYWMEAPNGNYVGWDMNYFDFNFNRFDYAVSEPPYGDALPIKLILDPERPK